MRIAQVVAVSRNGVIGRDGALIWKISDDLVRFKKLTLGHPVIMGRKTYDSIGRPLPGRTNIVISRTMAPVDGLRVVRSATAAIAAAREVAEQTGVDELFIIGGGEIYKQTLDVTDRIHLTIVDMAVDGDAHFPPLREGEWEWRKAGEAARSDRNQFACEFYILDRIPQKRGETGEVAEKP